jgi:hypothetical protein
MEDYITVLKINWQKLFSWPVDGQGAKKKGSPAKKCGEPFFEPKTGGLNVVIKGKFPRMGPQVNGFYFIFHLV